MSVLTRILLPFLAFLLFQCAWGQGFRANVGQIRDELGDSRPDVLFSLQSEDKTVHLRNGGFSYQFFKGIPSEALGGTHFEVHRIDVDLVGAEQDFEHVALGRSTTSLHYFPHAWGAKADVVDEVLYKEIYQGVDMRFTTDHGAFKYDVICKDIEALSRVRVRYRGGIGPPTMDGSGGVALSTRFGGVVESIPKSVLCNNGTCREVTVKMKSTLLPGEFAFELLGEWPEGSVLIIDPMPHQLWSTYNGGAGYDQNNRVAIDEQGNVLVAGQTDSFENVATSGAYQTELLGLQNCFLQQYSPDGTLLRGTYFGGELADRCYAMVVEPGTGNVYLGGGTFSPGLATIGAHQTQLASIDDALLLKFDATGTLQWSTYYGGPGHDLIAAMTLDPQGDLLLTGHSRSAVGVATDQTTLTGVENMMVAKFTAEGQLVWGSLLGATVDEGWAIGADDTGHVFVSGTTSSFVNISTAGAHQEENGGGRDAFLAKYSPTGSLLWATYYGGAGNETSLALVVSEDGSIVIAGSTESAEGIATSDAAQPLPGSENDGYLARFTSTGERIRGTYIGGEQLEEFTAMVEEPDGGLLICGWSQSLVGVTTPDAFQRYPAGEFDAVLLRCSASGALEWGTYLGGPQSEYAYDLARDPISGQITMVGITRSGSGVTTPNAQDQEFLGGLYDGFIARFCVPPSPAITAEDGALLCGPGPFRFTLYGVFESLAWNVGGTGNELAWIPPGPGEYLLYADVVGLDGCPGTSDTLMVVVADAFAPELFIGATPSMPLCTGVEVLLDLEPVFDTVLWWDGTSGPTASVTLQDTLPFSAVVTVFNAEGCAHRDSILLQARDCTFLPEQEGGSRPPRLYPNPARDRFHVEVSAATEYPWHAAFHAMDGRLLRRYVIAEGAVLQPGLGPGVYLVVFTAGTTGSRSTQVVELVE